MISRIPTLRLGTVCKPLVRWSTGPRFIGSLAPSLCAVLLWNFVGVLNMESALHIEYSLGTSSGWHSWLDRGMPGEVIRHWGVPIYDQWSGLGYRLPTQGFLVDTPLSYLAMFLPINSVMSIALVASLWFAFGVAHQWIHEWASRYRFVWCAIFDLGVIGTASFYAIWHGWKFLVIQIAGAVVCLVTLTGRQVVESPERVPLGAFMAKMSLGLLMVVVPHVGNGMTFAPAILALFLTVMVSRRMTLVRRVLKRPIVLVSPVLALVTLLPAILDLRRELQLQNGLPPYEPEFGFLNTSIPSGDLSPTQVVSWIVAVVPIFHHFIFPIIGLVRPSTYLWSALPYPVTVTSTVHLWSHDRAQFSGGLLAVILIYLAMRRPRSNDNPSVERAVGVLAAVAMFIALFNIDHPYAEILALRWVPVWLLSNSRWQYSDLALLLVLVMLIIRADYLNEVLSRRHPAQRVPTFTLRLGLAFGLISVLALFPYRVVEPIRLNGGQTRFAPLQTDAGTRYQNELWKKKIESIVAEAEVSNQRSSERVVISDLIEPEGEREWFGLRGTIQLRDLKLVSVLSASRVRSGQTLVPPRVRLRSNAFQVECERDETLRSLQSQLDFLAVSWAVLPATCWAESFDGMNVTNLDSPPHWRSTVSDREPRSIMRQLVSESAASNFRVDQLKFFHHWWSTSQNPRDGICSFLSSPCIEELEIKPGKQLMGAPLTVCEESCLATYELEEVPPREGRLVIPLNYDPAIRAEQNDKILDVRNFSGLTAIDSSSLERGRITMSLDPDYIMDLRAIAPLATILLIIVTCLVSGNVSKLRHVAPQD